MSNNNINTDSNIISLVDMKGEDNPGNSPDSEELLIKTSNKGKQRESVHYDKPPLGNKTSNSSMSFNIKPDIENQMSCSVASKGKDSQKLFSEPASSVVSDLEGDPDNLSITTSVITDTSDTNNTKTHHQNASQSLRNKRFSYNRTSSSHQWNTASSSNINSMANPSSATQNNNNNTNNSGSSNNGRGQFVGRQLSGSFAELINLTNQALSNTNTSTINNNNNNNEPASPSSRRNSISSNIQQNFYRLGLSENINIETVDPSSNDSDNDNRPSQVGPGETAWLLFRIYAIFKFVWSLIFSTLYFIHFVIKRSKSCDPKIYKFSIAFSIIFALQAISTLLLILYLPTSITRYTNVIRRRVVISNRAWKITALTFLGEIVMVIIGAILVFNKDPACSKNENMAYVTITKVIVIIVISLYTLLCFPFFIIPCACTFKLLPEYKGISDKVLKRFNSILYNPSEEVDEEEAPSCSICMENYKPGTRIKRLPCNHEFHPECITQWLETNNSCPICRQSFK